MKKSYIYIGLIFMIGMVSCSPKDDDDTPIDSDTTCMAQDSFYMTAMMNGNVWEGKTPEKGVVVLPDKRVWISGFIAYDLFRYDELSFRTTFDLEKKIPQNSKFIPAFFPPQETYKGAYNMVRGDSINNWIEITKMDEDAGIMEGRFEVLLQSKDGDLLEIRDGCFQTRYTVRSEN